MYLTFILYGKVDLVHCPIQTAIPYVSNLALVQNLQTQNFFTIYNTWSRWMSESNGTIETCESSRTSESIDCNCHSDSSDNSDSNDPECLF